MQSNGMPICRFNSATSPGVSASNKQKTVSSTGTRVECPTAPERPSSRLDASTRSPVMNRISRSIASRSYHVITVRRPQA